MRLDEIASAGGSRELLTELAEIFIEDVAHRLEQLEVAAASRDLDAVRAAAHAIKGAAGNFGAPRVAALAARVEASPASVTANGVVAELTEAYAAVREALQSEDFGQLLG